MVWVLTEGACTHDYSPRDICLVDSQWVFPNSHTTKLNRHLGDRDVRIPLSSPNPVRVNEEVTFLLKQANAALRVHLAKLNRGCFILQ